MKKITILSCLILMVCISHAQIKIGAVNGTPAASSMLEVESSNRGFLPPRIALSSRTMALNGVTPSDGMIVFNTNFSTDFGGLCIWHHSKWNKLTDSRPSGELTSYIELRQTVRQDLSAGNNNLNWNTVKRSQAPVTDLPIWSSGADIVIRRPGVYCIASRVTLNSVSTQSTAIERYIFVSKNGNQIAANGYSSTFSPFMNISAMVYCNANDIIRIGTYTPSTGQYTNVTTEYTTTCFVTQIPNATFE
ncbi:MAG: hypothetical protein EOO85_01245 [Pedobacter sp.]|nr:MAG: hypothetical protein EOO85_01245 [Pedobacter sp.]